MDFHFIYSLIFTKKYYIPLTQQIKNINILNNDTMKKSFLILALGLFTASLSFASTEIPANAATATIVATKSDSKISVQDISNLRLKVLFANVDKSTASVEIYNSKGEVFYKDLSETDKPLVLNVSHLDDGAYTLSISSGEDKLLYDFNIESQVTRVAVLKSK
jgi:hypothetical protein